MLPGFAAVGGFENSFHPGGGEMLVVLRVEHRADRRVDRRALQGPCGALVFADEDSVFGHPVCRAFQNAHDAAGGFQIADLCPGLPGVGGALDALSFLGVNQCLGVEDSQAAGLVEFGLFEQLCPGFAAVGAEEGLSAVFVMGGEDVLHAVAGPIDGGVVPVAADIGHGVSTLRRNRPSSRTCRRA